MTLTTKELKKVVIEFNNGCKEFNKDLYPFIKHYDSLSLAKLKRTIKRINNPIAYKASVIYNGAKTRAKQKELSFNLDVNWIIRNLRLGRCYFTGIELQIQTLITGGVVQYNSASLHRLDPEKGYLKSNCVIICNCINMLYSNHNPDDIHKVVTKLIENGTTARKNVTETIKE